MSDPSQFRDIVTVTQGQALQVITTLAERQSILLLSQPGLGKSDIVAQGQPREISRSALYSGLRSRLKT